MKYTEKNIPDYFLTVHFILKNNSLYVKTGKTPRSSKDYNNLCLRKKAIISSSSIRVSILLPQWPRQLLLFILFSTLTLMSGFLALSASICGALLRIIPGRTRFPGAPVYNSCSTFQDTICLKEKTSGKKKAGQNFHQSEMTKKNQKGCLILKSLQQVLSKVLFPSVFKNYIAYVYICQKFRLTNL